MKNKFFILFFVFLPFSAWGKIMIVAAENTYAQVAQRLGGDFVSVTSLMSRPNQDPHLFNATVTQAKALTKADIIVFNGAGYDTWIQPLLDNNNKNHQHIINVSKLMPEISGNPHLWYDARTLARFAHALTTLLKKQDPAHADYFDQQLKLFLNDYQKITIFLSEMKKHAKDKTVLLTETLFEPTANQLHLKIAGMGFAKNITNENSPTPSEIIEFEKTIEAHRAQVLIYNLQMQTSLIEHMKTKALQYQLPLVGISETQALNEDYITWMLKQLRPIDLALRKQ